ncbi:Uncharacterised protein [Streptococcus pneumoniae]|nr:Uncharacterised protein [Streptococcus pneumoniae]
MAPEEEEMALEYFYEEMEAYYCEEEKGEIFDLFDN